MSATLAQAPAVQINDRDSAIAFSERLKGLLISLTSHLQRETLALRAGQYAQGVADHETKADLIFAYRDALKQVKDHQGQLARFIPVKIDELRRLNETFQAELQVNLAAVSTAKAVSELLLTRLADQVSASKRPKTYGANGTMSARANTAAISVDRAL